MTPGGRRRSTAGPRRRGVIAPALIGVDVPAGTDHVVFRYRGYDRYPELLILAGLALIAIAIAPTWLLRRPRGRPASPRQRLGRG